MLKLLIRKQMNELFRSFFVNKKKNVKRSKLTTALSIALFGLLMVGVLGGMFTGLSILLCEPLASAGVEGLYFVIMGGIAMFLGIFGSVFNTYSTLYKAGDNDFLLSLPIPVRTIMTSRLITVMLMSAMYSGIALLPAVIVYLVVTPFEVMKLVGGIMFTLVIIAIVFSFSCLLGWVVAKVSVKLKNKSFVTVLLSLTFLALYYFVYFKAQTYIQDILNNAVMYGESLKGNAALVYAFGMTGAGDVKAVLGYTAFAAALTATIWLVLERSFIKLSTASGAQTKKVYVKGAMKSSGVKSALFRREYTLFVSNANYMLNCGLGLVFMPLMGVALLWKGGDLMPQLKEMLEVTRPDMITVILIAILCAMCALVDIGAASVSLEGKNLWICRSMPVETRDVLGAKLNLQLVFCLPAAFIGAVLTAIALKGSFTATLFTVLTPMACALLISMMGLGLNLLMPNLDWTSEMVPIKQGAPVAITLFGGWGIALVFGGAYALIGYKIGFTAYMAIATAFMLLADAAIYRAIMTRGVKAFEKL